MYSQNQFIEDELARNTSSSFKWYFSKGTNYTCYKNYEQTLSDEGRISNVVDKIRIIVYAVSCPIQFLFFYWTLIVFFLHRFNFRKPVMKLILFHFIFRCIGDILDKSGSLLPHYFANKYVTKPDGTVIMECENDVANPERHPLKWLITRQLGCTFWFVGEIVADWYPLLRTRAVAREKKSIRWVYLTCIIFNLSKAALIILHYTLPASQLYDKEGIYNQDKVDIFYFKYWVIQLIIIYASAIYEIVVYLVLKKCIFERNYSEFGFLKKFRSISEYRMLLAAIISIIFLPIVSITIIVKFYYYYTNHYHNIDFNFNETRILIANVPYYMIFIDQIMLLQSKKESKNDTTSYNNTTTYNNTTNFNTTNNNTINDMNFYKKSNPYNYKSANNSMDTSRKYQNITNEASINESGNYFRSLKNSISQPANTSYVHNVASINNDINMNSYKYNNNLLTGARKNEYNGIPKERNFYSQ